MTENLHEAISEAEAIEHLLAPEVDTQDTDDGEETEAEEAEVMADDEGEDAEYEATTDDDDEDALEAEEVEEDPVFEVKTVDGLKQVTQAELVEGYMLKADYTRKTMEVAEARKASEAASAEASQLKQQLVDALKFWSVNTAPEPDWASLATEVSPQEFNVRRVEWERDQKQSEQARQAHNALVEQEHGRRLQEEQAKLLETFPAWRDPDTYKAAAGEMTTALARYGFSELEAKGISDHRVFKVLQDAMKYRDLQAKQPAMKKKIAKAQPRLKPGAKPNKANAAQVARQKSMDRLKKEGSVSAAVDALFT